MIVGLALGEEREQEREDGRKGRSPKPPGLTGEGREIGRVDQWFQVAEVATCWEELGVSGRQVTGWQNWYPGSQQGLAPPLRCGVGTLTRPPWGVGGTAGLGTSQVSGGSPRRREQGKGAGRWKSRGPGGPDRRTRGGGRGVSRNEPEGRHLWEFTERSKAAPCCRQVASSLAILLGSLELSGERLQPSPLVPEQDRKPRGPLDGGQRG